MGKVKDFLGVLSESNKKLMEEAKAWSDSGFKFQTFHLSTSFSILELLFRGFCWMQERPDNFDIEVLSGNESNYIEMVEHCLN